LITAGAEGTSITLALVAAEGWFKDPFAVHGARWFSDGTPTDLVKDGSSEMSDPPPDRPITTSLEPVPGSPDPAPWPLDGSSLSSGAYDPEVIFEASSARGCLSKIFLGIWVGAAAVLAPIGLYDTGWGLVVAGIQAAVLVLFIFIFLVRPRRSRRLGP
jgi:hypothetical protein